MSFDFEIKWDEPEELDESNLNTGSFPDWGLLELAAVKNVTLFAKGETLILPEIVINGQPFSRNGIKLGGPTKAFFFTVKGNNSQTGEPFTAVRMYHNQTQFKIEDATKYPHLYLNDKQKAYYDKNGSVYVSDWANLQKPVLANVLKDKVQRLDKGGLYVRAENTTYHVRENPDQLDNEGKPRKYYSKYWSDFTVFETEAALLAAKAEEVGANVIQNGITYPANWGDSVDVMLKFIGSQLTPDTDLDSKVAEWKLTENGNPLNDASGNPVNVKAILQQAAGGNPLVEAVVNSWELKPF